MECVGGLEATRAFVSARGKGGFHSYLPRPGLAEAVEGRLRGRARLRHQPRAALLRRVLRPPRHGGRRAGVLACQTPLYDKI